jgi:predicted kinase
VSKLIMTRGIPASGKSTWAKQWVAEDPENRLRVNRDNLRWTLGIKTGIGTRAQEEEVTYWQREMVKRGFEQGKDVVLDDTNLRAKYAKDWMLLARAYGVEVEFQDFPISVEEANERDRQRSFQGQRFVGRAVIEDKYNRFTPNGKLPEPFVLNEEEVPQLKFEPYVPIGGENNRCIIVDIDGTLAHMEGRSPYDPTLYHTDSYDVTVGDIAMTMANDDTEVELIVMSGRDEQYRFETEKWLRDNYFEYDKLYMRPLGDTRNDAIVKNELFEKHIAGKYNVDFVLDDRDRVVAMWRAKGLKVLQVAEGAF